MAVDFGGAVILPEDAKWFIPLSENLYILASGAVGPDAFVFSAALDGERYGLSAPYSRFYRYDAGRWLCVEVDAAISDLLVLGAPQAGGEGLVVLGAEGEVWFVGTQTRTEQISTAQEGRFLGTMVQLRRGPETLHAVGLSGLCFRRRKTSWIGDDKGVRGFEAPFPRKRPVDVGQTTDVSDVATLPNGDQYLCGSIAIARPSLFWRPGGTGRWRWLGYAVDDPAYDYMVPGRILVEPPDTVWITTNKGVLVKGNAAQGFRIATGVARGGADSVLASFSNAVFHDGAIHVGSNVGPFRLRTDGGWDAFAPQTVPKPGEYPFASGMLDVSDSIIWAFGVRDVARYDGRQWHRISMPPVHRTAEP